MQLNPRLGAFGLIEERLLDEEDRMFLGEARKELLRALPHKSPAKMAEDEDAISVGIFAGGLDILPEQSLFTLGRDAQATFRAVTVAICIGFCRFRGCLQRNHVNLLAGSGVFQRRKLL